MFIDQVMKVPSLNRLSNVVISCKENAIYESGDKWGLGEPEDICSEDLWVFCKTNIIVRNGDEIADKESCVDLYQSLWFMMVITM